MKKRSRKVAKKVLNIVVVLRADGGKSHHLSGGFTSFVGLDGESRDEMIARARVLQVEWERKGYGPYMLAIGTLDAAVVFPTIFSVEAL